MVANLQREQNKIQNLLSSLSFALRSFNNLNQFLELTPLMASRVTDAEGSALVLYQQNKQVKLDQFYCQNQPLKEQINQDFISVINHINNYQTQHQLDPNFYPPLECFPVFVQEKIHNKLSCYLQIYSTPVLTKNVEIGRLYVFSQAREFLWSQSRKTLTQLVADQTAVAIANHQLTSELMSKERQDRELEIASEIQVRLLPRKCPNINGLDLAAKCETANRVGGDYYDFIPANYDQWDEDTSQIPDAPCQSWSIVIGDVMGKGVPAGLIMTMTRGMLRAEVLNRHSPARVLAHLNRVMYEDLDNSHRFVTLFYSEYDPRNRMLRYANAAHNPPLYWCAGTNTVRKLDTEGMLIGLQPHSDYEDNFIQLQDEDTVLYYTDGLTDAINKNNQRFEEENLINCFHVACQEYNNAQDILDHIFNAIKKFIGVGHYNIDDMTMIVVKHKPQEMCICN
ncbi:MAG: SpoIIE family protein phosphatase [Cyanobacterium sp. T60_A2020_053]|nr:SpoIIE family protein phosphatase [Cyanobacterium sp. T60_A2020_053]